MFFFGFFLFCFFLFFFCFLLFFFFLFVFKSVLQYHFTHFVPIPFIPLVSKFNVGLKSPLQQGLSEPEFYGDLVYKFRKVYACNDFNTQFREIILRYKKIGYNINLIRQTACMVVNHITVNNFASLFNCSPAG